MNVRLYLTAGLIGAAAFCAGAADTVKFNRDIRPIFSDTCFNCHGPDKNTRKAELRLDLRESALAKTKSGKFAIVPGKPEQSEAVRRVFSDDPKVMMPHPDSHKTLTAKQKNLIKQWVAEGAKYEQHWAYLPLTKPGVPKTGGANPIDSFVLAALAEKKIAPSPEADRATLLRRLSLDLTGLPPTPDEVAAFVNDTSANAWEKQVDRLLASPRFGERMASWWLDIVHFSDTVGFHGDQNQRIFPYRDYVINAFNANKPFDLFTREQLAGDLIPNATVEQRVASGFNRLNMMTREGGAQPKEYLAKYGAERVRTVGTAFLGSTFGCAECHDHKFDPILQKDFYSLQAFFADMKQWGVYADYGYTPEPELKGINNESPFPPEVLTDSPYLAQRSAKLRGQLAKLAQSALTNAAAQAELATWVRDAAAFMQKNPTGWITPAPEVSSAAAAADPKKKAASKPGAKQPAEFAVQPDGRVLFENNPADATTIKLTPGAMRLAAVRLELLPDAKHGGSILRGGATNSEMLKLSASLIRKGNPKPVALAVRHANADAYEARHAGGMEVVGVQGGWRTGMKSWNKPQTSVWQLDGTQTLADGDVVEVKIDGNKAGCVRVSLSPIATATAVSTAEMAAAVAALAKPEAAQSPAVLEAWVTGGNSAAIREDARKLLAKIYECHDGKMWSLTTEQIAKPLTVRILPRGNWMDESGAVVLPDSPEFLPGGIKSTKQQRQSRLDLAKWVCSTSNPMTARAVMNRLWKQFFGNALSAVVDDLGAQGEAPSHPELLDWVAAEFRDGGWNLKHMVKLMVTSSTYRQHSSLRPELKDVDPANRLLASQNPRRLDAEFVRDNALFAAGLLNLDGIGGPSAKPYQPAGYYVNLQFPNRDYIASADDEQWRRGVYMHWQRTFLHPMLANFDAPSRDECAAARNGSTTPQQALTLLNDPTFVEASRVFAARVTGEAKTDDERIARAFQLALARPPKATETASLKNFLASQRGYFTSNTNDAVMLTSVGLAPKPATDHVEQAAWTALCRVVLNLHETITRY